MTKVQLVPVTVQETGRAGPLVGGLTVAWVVKTSLWTHSNSRGGNPQSIPKLLGPAKIVSPRFPPNGSNHKLRRTPTIGAGEIPGQSKKPRRPRFPVQLHALGEAIRRSRRTAHTGDPAGACRQVRGSSTPRGRKSGNCTGGRGGLISNTPVTSVCVVPAPAASGQLPVSFPVRPGG